MPKLKVGDRVRITKVDFIDKKYGFKVGDIFPIRLIEDNMFFYFNDSPHNSLTFYESQLELVKSGRPRKEKPMKYLIVDKNYEFYGMFKTSTQVKKYISESDYSSDAFKVYKLGDKLKVTTKITLRKVK